MINQLEFEIEEIYCEEVEKFNPKNIKEYVDYLFLFNFPKTLYLKDNEIQCFGKCNRSVSDLFNLCYTRFKCSFEEFVYTIFEKLKDENYEHSGILLCDDIKKLVIFVRKRYYVTYFKEGINKNNLLLSNWAIEEGNDKLSFSFLMECYEKYKKEIMEKNKKYIIGVYGSLKKDYPNYPIIARSKFIREEIIEIPFKMISLGGFPGLLKSDKNNKVLFEIYEIAEDVYRDVESLEGYPNFYEKYKVISSKDNTEFEIYILNENNSNYDKYEVLDRISW